MAKKEFTLAKSEKLFDKALKLMPGGVSSNARLWRATQFLPHHENQKQMTLFIKKAHGSHIWDVDDNEYIDYRLGFGPVILGHSYPAVVKAIHEEENLGSVYAFDSPLEIEVAEMIMKMVPCSEMIRFSVTGTEATMHAIRVARAYTKKEVIVKFEGHYHGNHDYLLFSTHPPYTELEKKPYMMSAGIPESIRKLVIVEKWNDFESIEKTVKQHHDKIAAIITEPIMGNSSAIMPKKGYLKHLKELCDKYNIVLIFDEVKTGFRVAQGGAQELFKVKPHLATFAKSVSNGYPMSLITGQKEIMELFGPKGVAHGGTYTSNPVSLTAAKATLNVLKDKKVYEKLNSYGSRLMKGIDKVFSEEKEHFILQGVPEMFQFVCSDREEITNYKDLRSYCDFRLFLKIQFELMKNGVMIDLDNQECWYISLSHSEQDLKKTLDAFNLAVQNSKKYAHLKDRVM